MLKLQNISLYQFKNYAAESFTFRHRITGIYGNNGQGKTNLLDAIHYLCFTKSYFNRSDASMVLKDCEGMRVEGHFTKNEIPEKVVCILRENNKKQVLRNDEAYQKFSKHIGQFPVVMIAPDDIELVTGNSEVRRKFIDALLSQLDTQYLQLLITYNKVLQQRNSLLKTAADRGYLDEALLDTLNEQLIKPGQLIYNKRRDFLEQFLNGAAQAYNNIAQANEPIQLTYYSPLQQDTFANLLQAYRQKDVLLQRTTIGPHKDDIEINLHNENFKNIASQGQRKSLLFALKLTAFDQLKNANGFAPILLLDDVFEKLDANRMHNLLDTVCAGNTGQVFITDTHEQRLSQALSALQVDFDLINLNNNPDPGP